MSNLTKYSIFNEETGEIERSLTRKEKSRLDKMYSSIKTNDKNTVKNDTLIAEFIKNKFGDFNHLYYKNLIDKDYLFRFMYLCTYINYKNYVEFGNSKDLNRLIIKKDVFEIFNNLSRREVYNTINYFIENNFINEDKEGYIYINSKIINKGKINKNKGATRMFNNTIQELYNNATTKEHKKLGLFIKMLPYINFHYNVICKNIDEKNAELVEKINLTELAKIMGYSTTQRLKKDLFELKIQGENVIMIAKFSNTDMIVVNPKLYYKGNNIQDLSGIISLFRIANSKK